MFGNYDNVRVKYLSLAVAQYIGSGGSVSPFQEGHPTVGSGEESQEQGSRL